MAIIAACMNGEHRLSNHHVGNARDLDAFPATAVCACSIGSWKASMSWPVAGLAMKVLNPISTNDRAKIGI